MAKLRWTITDSPDADWEECLYHEVVQVRGGIAETNDLLSVEALQYLGFELIAETVDPVVSEE